MSWAAAHCYHGGMHAEDTYLFRHALVRDAAYEVQLPGRRAALHEMAFHAIENMCGGRAPNAGPELSDFHGKLGDHPSNALARELAEHARIATAEGRPGMWQPYRLYLQRAARLEGESHDLEASARSWRELATILKGVDSGLALRHAAHAYRRLASDLEAGELLAAAINIFRGSAERLLEGETLVDLGWQYRSTRGFAPARETILDGLRILEELGDPSQIAWAKGYLAGVEMGDGDTVSAESYYSEALAIFRELKNEQRLGAMLCNMAVLYMLTGRLEPARPLIEQGLAIHRSFGDRANEAIALGQLAYWYVQSGHHDDAERHYAQSQSVAREIGAKGIIGGNLHNLGDLYRNTGRFAEAKLAYRDAAVLHLETSHAKNAGSALGNLAGLHQVEQGDEEALVLYQRALSLFRAVDWRNGVGIYGCECAISLLHLNRIDEARTLWESSYATLLSVGDTIQLDRKRNRMILECSDAGVEPFKTPK